MEHADINWGKSSLTKAVLIGTGPFYLGKALTKAVLIVTDLFSFGKPVPDEGRFNWNRLILLGESHH